MHPQLWVEINAKNAKGIAIEESSMQNMERFQDRVEGRPETLNIGAGNTIIDTVLIPVPKVAIQSILAKADPLLRKLISVLVSNARSLSDHIARVVEDEK